MDVARSSISSCTTGSPRRGHGAFPARRVAGPRQRARLHPAQLHALRRRRRLPAGPDRAHARACGRSCSRCSRRSARRASSTCRRCRRASSRTSPATSTRTTRSSSACRPTRRSSARSCPSAAGAWSRPASSLRLQARPGGRRDLHQVPQDPQRRRVRRLHAGDPARRARRASSPACRMPTAAAASSATTAGWPSTAWTS